MTINDYNGRLKETIIRDNRGNHKKITNVTRTHVTSERREVNQDSTIC